MKRLAALLFALFSLVAAAPGQSFMVCKKDASHEVCRFNDGSAIETICFPDGDCSVFHWTKAEAAKRAKQLIVKPSYDLQRAGKVHRYMQGGMTINEANQKVRDEELAKKDAGVEKARIELCQQGILKGQRCKDLPAAAARQ